MSFQFECPNGHLLEGTPDQAGQQCHCPTCGMLFLIPEPVVEAPSPPGIVFPGAPAAGGNPLAPQGPELLHIPCPNGHELETPPEMLDQDVLCPQCQAQFTLRRKNSVEFKRQQEELEMIRMAKLSKAWLQGAIVAVVLIVIGLGALIAIRIASRN
ncbi:hypothetical protein ETAA8_64250 [Anatilimnocola aggregata]|uniref:Uncharacterized protein n=1 Tax=Anatilimnocola aggregata TaxID=2528021 RepID=A0A517YM25_9BACT|nr:hypothetical protein [Anatilimnocola aggregata]QDU31272.1 hypothetical protein ETAA8_64250 [Anatilimnocola aggregata]